MLQESHYAAEQQGTWSLGTVPNSKEEREVPVLGLVASNAALRSGQIVPSISFAVPGTAIHAIVSAARKDVAASIVQTDFCTTSLERIDTLRSKL